MPIVKLPDHGLSNSAIRRGTKYWIKQLVGVDHTKTDGFAFLGEWNRHNATVEVPEGTLYLSYVEDRSGAGRLRGRDITLYEVRTESVIVVQGWTLDAEPGWALIVRDEIAAYVTPVPRSPEELRKQLAAEYLTTGSIDNFIDAIAASGTTLLRAERAKLVKWIAEIDALLGESPPAPDAVTETDSSNG